MVGTEKIATFALAIRIMVVTTMGYGVMVTLQILVLSFLVRVRVSQPKAKHISLAFFVSTPLTSAATAARATSHNSRNR